MHKPLVLFALLFIISIATASSVEFSSDNYEISEEITLPNIDGFVASRSACKGLDSSAVRYVVTGGLAPYNVSWRQLAAPVEEGSITLNNDSDSINITGLNSAANYVFTILDANAGIPCVDTFNFTTMGSLGVDPSLTRPTCNGFTDGEATAIVLVGNQIYNPGPNEISYSWSNGDNNSTAVGLAEGSYSIVITTQEGCTAFNGFGLSAPGAIVVDATIDSLNCPGGTDAEIAVQPNGGTPSSGNIPYTIQWSISTTESYPDTIRNLAAGDYAITVTDANACQVFDTYTVPEPAPVSIQFSNQIASSCSRGICDGQAVATANGGATPGVYSYTWETGENSSAATLLCAGWNVIQVVNNGCPAISDSVLITSPNDVIVQTVDSTNVSCYNDSDGTVQVLASGGSPGTYTYSWNDNITGSNRNNLTAGIYSLIAIDMNGCESDTISVEIEQPDSLELVVDLGSSIDPRCSDTNNGIMSVRWLQGGNNNTTPNYTWSSNTPNAPNNPVATNLPEGTYSVTITDGLGCQDSTSYTLSAPPQLVGIIPSPTEPQCSGQLTVLTVDGAIGGSGNSFTFSVDNGPQNQLQFPTEVLAGTHLVSVFDQNACRFDTTLTIEQPDEVTVNIVDQIDVNLGESRQLMPIVPNSLDTANSTFQWSPDIELSCANCLSPVVMPSQSRTYQIEVIDENGCSGSDAVLVNLSRNRNVYIPNAFSPNGDGINDFFQLSTGIGVRQVNYLRIFDRWGNLVYEQQNYLPGNIPNDGWNGKLKGKNLNMGVFVYLADIEFIDNSSLLFRGDLNLVR